MGKQYFRVCRIFIHETWSGVLHIPGLKCNGASHPGKSGRNRIAVICMDSQHLTLLHEGHAMNNMDGEFGLDIAAPVACHERTGALCSRLQ